ncbi:MAG: hypothetical protein QOJ62_612 [Actinomycetota bacterium]|nr:hypothetical protein [Actinomycetota bacterium]
MILMEAARRRMPWRRWTVWQLPLPVRVLVLVMFGTYLSAFGTGLSTTALNWHDILTTIAFLVAAVLSVEASMRLAWPRARRDRISRDFLGVWTLPVALLLPPVYVIAMVTLRTVYMQLRLWHGDTIKVAYNAACIGLSYAAASVVAGMALGPGRIDGISNALSFGRREAVGVLFAVAAWWVVNLGLVLAIVALTGGRQAAAGIFKSPEGFLTDMVDVSVGVLAALLWAANPLAVVLLVPPVLLMQHQLFSGLRKAVRTDLLTDVANPQFWREVAGRELERAAASKSSLAILMVDIDHFKAVNDEYGHLTGDAVLACVARTITQALRPRDLVGRLGGEEFGAILAGLNLLDAEGAAERVRSQVSEVRVRSDRGVWVSVSVSVGVAELSVSGGDLQRLLGAADNALYAAKSAGRNCVRVAGPRRGEVIDLRARGELVGDKTGALDETSA